MGAAQIGEGILCGNCIAGRGCRGGIGFDQRKRRALHCERVAHGGQDYRGAVQRAGDSGTGRGIGPIRGPKGHQQIDGKDAAATGRDLDPGKNAKGGTAGAAAATTEASGGQRGRNNSQRRQGRGVGVGEKHRRIAQRRIRIGQRIGQGDGFARQGSAGGKALGDLQGRAFQNLQAIAARWHHQSLTAGAAGQGGAGAGIGAIAAAARDRDGGHHGAAGTWGQGATTVVQAGIAGKKPGAAPAAVAGDAEGGPGQEAAQIIGEGQAGGGAGRFHGAGNGKGQGCSIAGPHTIFAKVLDKGEIGAALNF